MPEMSLRIIQAVEFPACYRAGVGPERGIMRRLVIVGPTVVANRLCCPQCSLRGGDTPQRRGPTAAAARRPLATAEHPAVQPVGEQHDVVAVLDPRRRRRAYRRRWLRAARPPVRRDRRLDAACGLAPPPRHRCGRGVHGGAVAPVRDRAGHAAAVRESDQPIREGRPRDAGARQDVDRHTAFHTVDCSGYRHVGRKRVPKYRRSSLGISGSTRDTGDAVSSRCKTFFGTYSSAVSPGRLTQ